MSFARHVKYKSSGVEWLGDIPTHWKISPLFSVVTQCDEPNNAMTEGNLLSLSYGRIVRKDINANDGLLPESFETYQIVRSGDIVLRLTDLQNDKRSLRTALVEETGIITSAYVAVKPFGVSSKFINYLLRAYDVQKVFYSMGGGLRQSMKFADLKRLPILLPTKIEQDSIVGFLDREIAKINALIQEQQRLTQLLAEKRDAAISEAITVRLGEKSTRLGHLIDLKPGFAFPSERYSPEETGIRLLRGINVGVGECRWDDTVYWTEALDSNMNGFTVLEGDIVLGMDRPWINSGTRVARVRREDLPALLVQRVARIRAHADHTAEFIQLVLASKEFRRIWRPI